jgi:hypothetical protein
MSAKLEQILGRGPANRVVRFVKTQPSNESESTAIDMRKK